MKAWIVREDSEGHAVIIFNNHGLAARREGASELDLNFEQVECDRAKQFDEYESHVPADVLVKEYGWWFECYQCYKKIEKDMKDFDKVIFLKDSFYCCQGCVDKHKKNT